MSRQNTERIELPQRQPPIYERIIGSSAGFFKDRSVWIPTVMSVVILLTLVATIFLAVQVSHLRDRVGSAEEKLAALAESTQGLQPGWADSSFADVQPLGMGFSLVDFKAEPVDAGVRVTGSIINGSSLDYYDAAFTVTLAPSRQAKVVIPTLAAGHSASFDAIVGPETDKSIPKRVRILFAGSEVSYY